MKNVTSKGSSIPPPSNPLTLDETILRAYVLKSCFKKQITESKSRSLSGNRTPGAGARCSEWRSVWSVSSPRWNYGHRARLSTGASRRPKHVF